MDSELVNKTIATDLLMSRDITCRRQERVEPRAVLSTCADRNGNLSSQTHYALVNLLDGALAVKVLGTYAWTLYSEHPIK